MARRLSRAEQQAETRRKLLKAAEKVFSRIGLSAATLDEIAEAAGFTRGAVYANFQGKEGLFMALLEEEAEAQLAAWQTLSAAAPTGGDERHVTGARLASQVRRMDGWGRAQVELYAWPARQRTSCDPPTLPEL